MNCDMCGKDTRLFKTKIENAMMDVCKVCSKFGEIISEVVEEEIEKKGRKFIKREIENEVIELVREGYGLIIKKAREKKGLKQEELAKEIKEKTSLIHKLENELIEPSLKLAKKLEKFLRIKLIEYYENKEDKISKSDNSRITIGDLLDDKPK